MKHIKTILVVSALTLLGAAVTACEDEYNIPPVVKPPVVIPDPDPDPDTRPGDEYFGDFPAKCDPEMLGVEFCERFITVRHSYWGNINSDYTANHITYPDVCTWLGALWFAEKSGNDKLWDRLADKFDLLFTTEVKLQPDLNTTADNKVDYYVFGAIPLYIYQRRKDNKYLELGLKYADGQYTLPANPTAAQRSWHDQGYSWQTRLWIDDMFMITALQMQAFLATGNSKYMKRAAAGMVLYLERLQKTNGLFYHATTTPFYWARGNGWMAVGMTEVLRLMPQTSEYSYYRLRISEGYKKMMAGLLQYQTADGMWTQLIDKASEPDMWKETSGSAMFTYAFIEGVKNGWLDGESYGPAARKAWITLQTYLTDQYDIREVCEGTGEKNSYEWYRDRRRWVGDMHGQAGMLWSARALIYAPETEE